MDKLASIKRRCFSASLDIFNFERPRKQSEEDRFLKCLAFSANSISLLPVFIASNPSETELKHRASSVEILTPRHLNKLLTAAVPLSRTDKGAMPPPPLDTDTFKATLLWEKIVLHLERSVKCGRRSQGLRIFGDCFPGSKAVECLTIYLNTILPKTVKRTQVRVLCQKLQLTGVIEDVRSKEKTVFRENRLYRFTRNHFWEPIGGSDGASSESLDEKQEGMSRSKSLEHTLESHTPEKVRQHSKGYASDSATPAPSSISSRRRHRTVTTALKDKTNAKGPRISSQHGRGKTCNAALKNTESIHASGRHHMIAAHEKVYRRTEQVADIGGRSKRDTVFGYRREKRKLPSPIEDQQIVSNQNPKDHKRHSLHLRATGKARERDFAMCSYRHEVRQRILAINTGYMHRSHSFSSSSTLSNASGESSRKWIVYGFV